MHVYIFACVVTLHIKSLRAVSTSSPLYNTKSYQKQNKQKNPADKEPFILYLWCFCFLPFSGQQRHHPPPALTNNNQHEEETSA